MKLIFAAFVGMAACGPALACNAEMLTVQEWKAVENEGNAMFPVDLSAKVQYEGPKAFRMIHAGVIFSDALGRNIGQTNLDEDQFAAPGDIVHVEGYVSADVRLLAINPEDVETRTCVWSVVYDDGTVEKFD